MLKLNQFRAIKKPLSKDWNEFATPNETKAQKYGDVFERANKHAIYYLKNNISKRLDYEGGAKFNTYEAEAFSTPERLGEAITRKAKELLKLINAYKDQSKLIKQTPKELQSVYSIDLQSIAEGRYTRG